MLNHTVLSNDQILCFMSQKESFTTNFVTLMNEKEWVNHHSISNPSNYVEFFLSILNNEHKCLYNV